MFKGAQVVLLLALHEKSRIQASFVASLPGPRQADILWMVDFPYKHVDEVY